VINEVIVGTGPDPDLVPPVTTQPAPAFPTPAWLQSIQKANSDINTQNQSFSAVTPTAAMKDVVTAVTTAIGAATDAMKAAAALGAASTAADIAKAKLAVDSAVTASAAAAATAAKAVGAMGSANTGSADFSTATSIATLAQKASKATQDLQAALLSASPAPPTAATSATFGLMEIRGRMLSKDATFKISQKSDSDNTDFQLTFDHLEPSPKDDKHVQQPRVIERDPDTTDNTLAKRLLLVVRLDATTSGFVQPKSTHTVTVTNPDSQKVLYRFDVPDSQKPS